MSDNFDSEEFCALPCGKIVPVNDLTEQQSKDMLRQLLRERRENDEQYLNSLNNLDDIIDSLQTTYRNMDNVLKTLEEESGITSKKSSNTTFADIESVFRNASSNPDKSPW
jgi:hypothetical protein